MNTISISMKASFELPKGTAYTPYTVNELTFNYLLGFKKKSFVTRQGNF